MDIDTNYIVLNRALRYLLNIGLLYLLISSLNCKELTSPQTILLICMISSIILYILDFYLPLCTLIIEDKKSM